MQSLTPKALTPKALTPKEILAQLNVYVVGQDKAKRAVAVALRNRWRRRQLDADLAADVYPKNILLIGPTGVGKTEIARRLAGLARAPFVKVEASKYSEVGYHGRDVESMVRDLMEAAVALVQQEHAQQVAAQAKANAEERIGQQLLFDEALDDLDDLRAGKLEQQMMELDLLDRSTPTLSINGPQGAEAMGIDTTALQEAWGRSPMPRMKRRRLTIAQARIQLQEEEAEKLVDEDAILREAKERAENDGIIFLDEVDKIVGSGGSDGPDVSREGVQRDLLPIVEGCTVYTRYGHVRTDHMLFLAAGAFHFHKPSELIPELQGRFPVRVALQALTEADFVRILTQPRNSLVRQYQALFQTEGVELTFSEEGLQRLAGIAFRANETTQNIGARRLMTIMEKCLEELSFDASERGGSKVHIDKAMVEEALGETGDDEDLIRYDL